MRTINSSPSINALAFAEPNLELSPPAKIAAVIRDFMRYSQDDLLFRCFATWVELKQKLVTTNCFAHLTDYSRMLR